MRIFGEVLAALGFLTALPGPRGLAPPRTLARSLAYYPLVGGAIGALLVLVDLALAPALPAGPRAALLLLALLLVTRALHLDGLIDSCDGLFGGFTPERRLAIMRDSHVGAFGVLGALADLLARYACLVALTGQWRVAALVGGTALGRWALVYALVAFPYGRPEGLGRDFKAAAGARELALASLGAAVIGAAAWWPWGAAGVALAWAVAWVGARFILRRIPGLTGDSYGALNEVTELVVWLLLVAGQTLAGG